MKVIAMTLSVLVALGAFGQGQGEDEDEGEGEDESAASPVCFNMNAPNADAAADDVCFPPIEGYERIAAVSDHGWPKVVRSLPPSNAATESELHHGDWYGFQRSTVWAHVYYAPQDPTGRAMMVEIARHQYLPLHSRTKPRGAYSETIVWAELLAESHNGGGEAPRTLPYNVLRRTDAGTLVVEDCDYNHDFYDWRVWQHFAPPSWGYYHGGVVLGEGDDLRNVDRMVRRYLEGLANPAVCTLPDDG